MVKLAPLSLAAMSLFTLVSTSPLTTVTAGEEQPVFSFAKWVDDIIANPETALGPAEAWQAYLNSVNSTSTTSSSRSRSIVGPLHARDAAVTCQNTYPGPAYVSFFLPPVALTLEEVKLT